MGTDPAPPPPSLLASRCLQLKIDLPKDDRFLTKGTVRHSMEGKVTWALSGTAWRAR